MTVLGHCSQHRLQMQLFSGGNLRSGVRTCSVSSKQESDKVSNKLVTGKFSSTQARYYPEELVAAEKKAKGEPGHGVTRLDRKTPENPCIVGYSICKHVGSC
ncbi:unnamed protein product [Tetraodon nigroviridis]|uniref:(spotted green pufferfish) hypothetical protein n=1 Tax=Tetraodon nigroviridis TaxID=99883 RepID=Q4RI39_TETNG|nr:unnamed protein product [Tetraodon nigroviridis]